jgi:hypothetical protein
MLSAVQSAEEAPDTSSDDRPDNPLIRLALTIRQSFLAFIAAGSVLMIILALVIDVLALKRGVIQAMFLIWGISGLIYAGGGFLLLRLIGYR